MKRLVSALRAGDDSPETLCGLAQAWGNTSHSLRPAALQRLHRLTLAATLPVLDVGSGLSTIIAAVAAEKSAVPVFALESDKGYLAKLDAILAHLGLTVELRYCAMVGGWYAVPDDLPESFAVVNVDGPQDLPRRGLVYQILADRIAGAHVIADDISFRPIAIPFNRWNLATGRVAERFGSFAVSRAP